MAGYGLLNPNPSFSLPLSIYSFLYLSKPEANAKAMEELAYLSNLSLPFEEIEGDYLSTGARALGDYLSTLPQAKEIKGARIHECNRCFLIDAGDYIHRVLVGIVERQDRFVVVAGDSKFTNFNIF